jgi:hypothetical protein
MNEKELALRIMMLLSALESWAWQEKNKQPEYLMEELEYLQDKLKEVVLG